MRKVFCSLVMLLVFAGSTALAAPNWNMGGGINSVMSANKKHKKAHHKGHHKSSKHKHHKNS